MNFLIKNADCESILINLSGISIWYLLWMKFNLFHRISIDPLSNIIFFSVIGVFLFKIRISRNGPQEYKTELEKVKDIETNSRTICGYIITLFLCSRILEQINLPKKVHTTFYILLALASAFSLINLFDFSLPQKPHTIRILRKVESVSLNLSTSFTLLMILYISLNIIQL